MKRTVSISFDEASYPAFVEAFAAKGGYKAQTRTDSGQMAANPVSAEDHAIATFREHAASVVRNHAVSKAQAASAAAATQAANAVTNFGCVSTCGEG